MSQPEVSFPNVKFLHFLSLVVQVDDNKFIQISHVHERNSICLAFVSSFCSLANRNHLKIILKQAFSVWRVETRGNVRAIEMRARQLFRRGRRFEAENDSGEWENNLLWFELRESCIRIDSLMKWKTTRLDFPSVNFTETKHLNWNQLPRLTSQWL